MMRRQKWAWTSLIVPASVMLGILAGCQPLPADSLVNADDVTIRQSAINDILQNNSLTEAEKRQQLEDLGITDQSLIDALLMDGSIP
jgi:hypothetical protein